MSTRREGIQASDAPAAIGPYSQAIRCGDLLFCSGQIGIEPDSGALVSGGVAAECERVMQNLSAVLRAAGLGWGDVVRATIYLTDLEDFPVVNEIYGRHLADPPPARATVGVAALPKGARVEIDAIARRVASKEEG